MPFLRPIFHFLCRKGWARTQIYLARNPQDAPDLLPWLPPCRVERDSLAAERIFVAALGDEELAEDMVFTMQRCGYAWSRPFQGERHPYGAFRKALQAGCASAVLAIAKVHGTPLQPDAYGSPCLHTLAGGVCLSLAYGHMQVASLLLRRQEFHENGLAVIYELMPAWREWLLHQMSSINATPAARHCLLRAVLASRADRRDLLPLALEKGLPITRGWETGQADFFIFAARLRLEPELWDWLLSYAEEERGGWSKVSSLLEEVAHTRWAGLVPVEWEEAPPTVAKPVVNQVAAPAATPAPGDAHLHNTYTTRSPIYKTAHV